jgi:ppGpp synthetase/RelA/SpoT-type nucleotidyltranferase
MLENRLEDEEIYCYVTSRVKTEESFLGKAFRPGKAYGDPFRDVKDIVGLRVIVREPSDAESVEKVVCSIYSRQARHSGKAGDRLKEDQFGYRAIHVVARLPARVTGMPAFEGCTSMSFEVQIHTLIEHAWSELSHKLWYKPLLGEPDSDDVRTLSRISATLDGCEIEIAKLWRKARRRAAISAFTCRQFLGSELARQVIGKARSAEIKVASSNRDVSGLLEAAKLARFTKISELTGVIDRLGRDAVVLCAALRRAQEQVGGLFSPVVPGFLFGFLVAASTGCLRAWGRGPHMTAEMREVVCEEVRQASNVRFPLMQASVPRKASGGRRFQ